MYFKADRKQKCSFINFHCLVLLKCCFFLSSSSSWSPKQFIVARACFLAQHISLYGSFPGVSLIFLSSKYGTYLAIIWNGNQILTISTNISINVHNCLRYLNCVQGGGHLLGQIQRFWFNFPILANVCTLFVYQYVPKFEWMIPLGSFNFDACAAMHSIIMICKKCTILIQCDDAFASIDFVWPLGTHGNWLHFHMFSFSSYIFQCKEEKKMKNENQFRAFFTKRRISQSKMCSSRIDLQIVCAINKRTNSHFVEILNVVCEQSVASKALKEINDFNEYTRKVRSKQTYRLNNKSNRPNERKGSVRVVVKCQLFESMA